MNDLIEAVAVSVVVLIIGWPLCHYMGAEVDRGKKDDSDED